MSDEELIKNLKPNVCGIFSPEQMPSQQSYKGLKRMAFYSLMLFSLLGFNVKPMTASTAGDTSKQKEESLYVKKGKELRIQKREYRQQEKDKKKRKRNKIFRKKRKFKPLGCIEF